MKSREELYRLGKDVLRRLLEAEKTEYREISDRYVEDAALQPVVKYLKDRIRFLEDVVSGKIIVDKDK